MNNIPPKRQTQLKSFAAAFCGLKVVFKNERNFRIHIVVTIIAIIACTFFRVSAQEWIIVIMLIGFVLSIEALNTCIEYICNYIKPDFSPIIKKIKDIAAGAVLLSAITAVIVGCIVFFPYVLNFFK